MIFARYASLLGMVIVTSAPEVARADDPADGEVVAVEAKYLFAPIGFDDNDETMVVVDGFLPSGCYRLTEPKAEIDVINHVVRVTPQARFFNIPCVEAMIPYNQEIRLGVLPEGNYTVALGVGSLARTLSIAEATNAGPDDFLYAPVDEATVQRSATPGRMEAVIKGRFTNDCMSWSEMRVLDNGPTINILPIISMNSGDTCRAGEFPYEKTVSLPDTVAAGRHLLHVRSLNGKAVNVVFWNSFGR